MENLIHPKFRSGTDNPNAPFFYYLINNEVFGSDTEMLKKTNYGEIHDVIGFERWRTSLVKLECSESELEKILYRLGWKSFTESPTDITLITTVKDECSKVCETECIQCDYMTKKVYFKERDRGINIILVDEPKPHKAVLYESDKYHGHTLEYWKQNAEEKYITTPLSVLKYITALEEALKTNQK